MEQTTILTILTLITLICACSYLSMCLWNPHTVSDRAALESVQRRAARWVCGSRWSPVQKHWAITDYCSFNTSCTRAHNLSFVPPQSTINSHRFPSL